MLNNKCSRVKELKPGLWLIGQEERERDPTKNDWVQIQTETD